MAHEPRKSIDGKRVVQGDVTADSAYRRPTNGPLYKWSADAWLEAFAKHRSVDKACKHVGIKPRTAYDRRVADPEFRARWLATKELFRDQLRASALDRAIEGYVKPIWREIIERDAAGTPIKDPDGSYRKVWRAVGVERHFETALTIHQLKALIPEEQSETAIAARAFMQSEHEQLRAEANVELEQLSPEGRDALRVFLRERKRAQDQLAAEEVLAGRMDSSADAAEPDGPNGPNGGNRD